MLSHGAHSMFLNDVIPGLESPMRGKASPRRHRKSTKSKPAHTRSLLLERLEERILLSSSPDLYFAAASGASPALLGGDVSLSWTVKNKGDASATGSWTDRVYLSSSPNLDG